MAELAYSINNEPQFLDYDPNAKLDSKWIEEELNKFL